MASPVPGRFVCLCARPLARRTRSALFEFAQLAPDRHSLACQPAQLSPIAASQRVCSLSSRSAVIYGPHGGALAWRAFIYRRRSFAG